ncbi:MAG TPA: ester cyclase [Acidimicrobiales bacterium]|nr:ester cyclase [Acidimicrobiales bacterium]
MPTINENQVNENKTIVRDYIDALFTHGDLGAGDRYLSPEFVNHDVPFGAAGGAEGMRAAASMFREACPDWSTSYHQLVAEGDVVVEHFTASGSFSGSLMGVSGTGQTLSLPGINIFRVRDGRIVERCGRLDELGLLSQLGLAPGPHSPS